MDPYKTIEAKDKDGKPVSVRSDLFDLLGMYDASRTMRQQLEPRWAMNDRIRKGIPLEETSSVSKVTGRKKIYFRKVWSAGWRLLASFYQSFLQDKNRFKIYGADEETDWMKAYVLEWLTKHHLKRLFRQRSGFIKLLWAFLDCIFLGTGVIKLCWKYNKDTGEDRPDFTAYPLEQVCLDWAAESPSDMRFCAFENYLTKADMEEMGYKNVDQAVATSIPSSTLRFSRYTNSSDPARPSSGDGQNYANGTVGAHFPNPGEVNTAGHYDHPLARYCAVEMFWKEKGKIWFAVFDPNARVFLKEPEESPYGKIFPVAVGTMLLEAHKMIAEGLPEVLEGPQEALNMDINLRKDNVRLAMTVGFIYGKYGGVDKQALRNIKPGMAVGANDPSQVAPLQFKDVTQNAHIEIAQDGAMIDEESGVNATTQGMSSTGKTGEAQINLSQSSVKLDLNTAVVGQTLFHQFIYVLAYMISKFETNEQLFKKANASLIALYGKDLPDGFKDIYDIDDFDADVEVEVGFSEVSRAIRTQRAMGFMQMMSQANMATFQALAQGIKMENPRVFNVGEASLEFAPDFGIQNPSRFLVAVQPPPPETPEAGEAGGGAPAQDAAGEATAQPNAGAEPQGFEQFMSAVMGGAGGESEQ